MTFEEKAELADRLLNEISREESGECSIWPEVCRHSYVMIEGYGVTNFSLPRMILKDKCLTS